MSISASTALRVIKFIDNDEIHLLMACHNHLCYALTWIDDKRFLREIDEQCHEFSTIICIYSARRIEHRDAMFQGKTAARTYLRLIAYGQGNVQTCRYQSALKRIESDRLRDICTKIHSSTLRCGILRERLRTVVYYFYFQHDRQYCLLIASLFYIFSK